MALLVGFMYHLLHIEIIRLLKKKRLDPHFSVPKINELNIYKLDPSELPGLSEIKSDEQVWSFFCEPDYKYANSKRANRKTGCGNWKITGKALKVKDKTGKVIGSKKILVYQKRVASKMVKTDWVMHEFSVKDSSRYKKDFVFCDIEKNPNTKSNISTSDDDQHQPSQSVASDAETYATEKASTEVVESQQPSNHGLRNNSLEVESEVLSNRNLVPDTGNNFVPNTSSMEEPQQLSNQNLGFDPRNNFADNTSPVEAAGGLLSKQNLVSDQKNPFIPIASSMVESEFQSNHSLVSVTGNYFATNTSTVEEPQLLSNQNLGFDTSNYLFADNTSSMEVEPGLLSKHSLFHDPSAPITSSMLLPHQNLDSLMVGHQLLSNYNMVFDPMNHSAPCTSSMVGPQLLSNDQNMVFGPINHSASITSSMQVESQLLSNPNLVFDPMNNSAPCTSSMVGPQLLSNQNMVFDPINYYAPVVSSMQVESQLLSNQNLVSDYSRNYLVPDTSSMVGHDQLLSNNNFFSDPRNQFAPNTCLMVHPQVAELFAQFTALLGRYLLNQSLVSAPQWQINPQQGSYSSLYSNGAFGNNCTSSSSEFHRGLEDAWIAQGSFQDKHPEEATGQDFSY